MEGIDRLLEELHLHLIFLLDFAVLHNDLLVVVLDEVLQLLKHSILKFVIVVNALSHKIDCVLESANVVVILPDLSIGDANSSLHVLLLESEVLDQEAQIGIH